MKSFKILFIMTIVISSARARDEKKRFLLHQDRLKVDRLFRPLKHNFHLSIEGTASHGIKSYVDDIADIAESNDLVELEQFIREEGEKEHFINGSISLGIPFSAFRLWRTKFIPSVRASFDLGGSLATTTRTGVINFGDFTASLIDPKTSIYLRQDTKFGVNLDLEYESHHYGSIHLYNFNRWDRQEAISKTDINENDKLFDLDQPKNTTNNIALDLKYGFRGDNFTLMAAIEEIKLSTLSDSKGEADVTNGGALYNNIDALFRLHAEYVFEVGLMDFIPYVGLHNRSGYNLDDGIYYGLEWIPEFTSFQAGARIDSEFYNLSARIKYRGIQLGYTTKIAHKDRADGFEVPNMHLANIRLSF